MPLAEPIRVAGIVADALERLGIRYLIGGSLASSLHGIPRATQDIDFVIDIVDSRISALVQSLSADFFVGEPVDHCEHGP